MDRNHRLRFRIGGLFASMAFGLGVANAQVDVERARQNMEQAARDNASSQAQEQAQREYWRAQEAARLSEANRQQQQADQQRRSQEQSDREKKGYSPNGESSPGGGYMPSPSGGNGAGAGNDFRALGKEMLRLPPLPAERNVLLGSWRLEGGGQQSRVLEFGLTGKGATPGMGELMGFMKSIDSGQLACDMSFGRGVTFTPTTFSSGGAAGIAGGPVAYRSRKNQVIAAIPGDSRANPMFFEIVGPNRIV